MPVEDVFNPCAARRALLLGAGALGVAALTGCGGDEPPANAGGAASSAPPAPTTAAGNPFDNTGSGGSGEQAPPAGTLVAVKDVPVGGGLIVKDTVLVVQPAKGTIKAFKANCPHQGVIVDPPFDGNPVIQCPGHNSQFKTADGSLVRGPATRGLSGIPVKVQNGYVIQV